MSEFHRQCVFSALTVVGGVDGKNVFFPSAQLCGVVLPDAVNIDRVDVAQRTEQPFFTELAVVLGSHGMAFITDCDSIAPIPMMGQIDIQCWKPF